MGTIGADDFTQRLIAETLFYDDEYEALGNLSLIDADRSQERYIGSYVPEDHIFVVEEGVEWEEYTPGQDDDIGYALAVDSKEVGSYDTAEETAAVLLMLAKEHSLLPSVTLLFEEEEVS